MSIIAGTPRNHHTLMNEHQIAIPCQSIIQRYSIFPSSRPPFSPTLAAANSQAARRRRDSGSNDPASLHPPASSPSAINEHLTPKIQQLHARIQPTPARTNAKSSVAGVISCPRSHALAEPISSIMPKQAKRTSISPAATPKSRWVETHLV
ncbi:hypothetical protein ACLOJK_027126 [Asimina triloba]